MIVTLVLPLKMLGEPLVATVGVVGVRDHGGLVRGYSLSFAQFVGFLALEIELGLEVPRLSLVELLGLGG